MKINFYMPIFRSAARLRNSLSKTQARSWNKKRARGREKKTQLPDEVMDCFVV